MSGWIALHRKILGNPLFEANPAARHLFVDMLMRAAWQTCQQDWRGNPVEVQRGQLMISTRELARLTGFGHQKTRTILASLANHSMIEVNTLPNQGPMIVSVCKYSEYQDQQHTANTPDNTQLTHTQHTKEQLNNKTSSLLAGEIEGLNGQTSKLTETLAGWLQPFAPDKETAFELLESNCATFGPSKVMVGMLELKTQIAGGDKPKNVVKAFTAYVKNADPDAKPRQANRQAVATQHNAAMAAAFAKL